MKYLPPLSHEPIVYATLLNAVLDVAVAFGAPIAPEQKAAIMALIGAASAIFVRAVVTPNAKLPVE